MTHITSTYKIARRFKPSLDWRNGTMINSRGAELSTAHSLPENKAAIGHVLLVEGLGEYKQKFAELARSFNRQAWGFHIFDRQGQGLSGRGTPHPHKLHCDDYRDDVADIMQFAMTKIPQDGKPLVMLAHSTGGLLALPVLYQDSQQTGNQRRFKAAVLTDPLWGFLEPAARNRDPLFAKLPMPELMRKTVVPGGLKDWVPRNHQHSLHKPEQFSSDHERAAVHDYWQITNPKLRTSGATMGWLQEMSKAMVLIRTPGYVEDIKHAITVCTSDMTLHIDPQRITETMPRFQNAQRMPFPLGKHELLMERSEIRTPIINEVIRLGIA